MEIKQYTIDCRCFTTVSDAHRYLAALFGFPDYYGRNLDALYDCLTEIPSCVIRIQHPWALVSLGDYAVPLLKVFSDIASERQDISLI